MSKISLTVNATGIFTSVEEARTVGQFIDKLLSGAEHYSGSVNLTEVPAGKRIPLVQPTYDKSKVVRGGQEAEGNAMALTKEIEKSFIGDTNSTSANEFWADFITASKNTGEVDYAALKALTGSRLGLEDGTAAVVAAAGVVASNQIARSLRPAPVKKQR